MLKGKVTCVAFRHPEALAQTGVDAAKRAHFNEQILDGAKVHVVLFESKSRTSKEVSVVGAYSPDREGKMWPGITKEGKKLSFTMQIAG